MLRRVMAGRSPKTEAVSRDGVRRTRVRRLLIGAIALLAFGCAPTETGNPSASVDVIPQTDDVRGFAPRVGVEQFVLGGQWRERGDRAAHVGALGGGVGRPGVGHRRHDSHARGEPCFLSTPPMPTPAP